MICEGSGWQQHIVCSSSQVAWSFLEPALFWNPVLCYKGIGSCSIYTASWSSRITFCEAISGFYLRDKNLLISASLSPFSFLLHSLRYFLWSGDKVFWVCFLLHFRQLTTCKLCGLPCFPSQPSQSTLLWSSLDIFEIWKWNSTFEKGTIFTRLFPPSDRVNFPA